MQYQNILGLFLTQMRNGLRKGFFKIKVRKNKSILGILKCLYRENFIEGFYVCKDEPNFVMVLLKYDQDYQSIIQSIERISKPSRRIYINVVTLAKYNKIHSIFSTLILNTNKGVLSHHEALQKNVGGEIICRIK